VNEGSLDNRVPTVFVVDDDPAVCRAIASGVELVLKLPARSYPTAEEFLADFDPALPGCLVLDVKMPGMNGLELQQALGDRGSLLPIIMISGHAQVPTAVAAMRAGALILLEKPFDMQQLHEQIRLALRIDAESRDQQQRHARLFGLLATLTPREREIMDLLVAGKTNKEISAALRVSVPTVDKHRWSVFEKLHVANAVELVRLANNLAR
jgi:FixJ family two-component response regulator